MIGSTRERDRGGGGGGGGGCARALDVLQRIGAFVLCSAYVPPPPCPSLTFVINSRNYSVLCF